MCGWGYVLTILGFVLFRVTIITPILFLARSTGTRGMRYDGGAPDHGMAEDLLAERCARGEIEESEYTARLEALRRVRGPHR